MSVDVERASAIIGGCNVGFEVFVFAPFMVYLLWESFGAYSLFGFLALALIIYLNGVFVPRKFRALKVSTKRNDTDNLFDGEVLASVVL